jgi:uncharacterized membrane protein
MELFFMSGIGFVFLFIVSLAITIAPLLIWRNTNRTNKLLGAIAAQQGVSQKDIDKILGVVTPQGATQIGSWDDLKKSKKDKKFDFE